MSPERRAEQGTALGNKRGPNEINALKVGTWSFECVKQYAPSQFFWPPNVTSQSGRVVSRAHVYDSKEKSRASTCTEQIIIKCLHVADPALGTLAPSVRNTDPGWLS